MIYWVYSTKMIQHEHDKQNQFLKFGLLSLLYLLSSVILCALVQMLRDLCASLIFSILPGPMMFCQHAQCLLKVSVSDPSKGTPRTGWDNFGIFLLH